MEFIMFGNQEQLIKCKTKSIKVVEDDIEMSEEIKYLGTCLDRNLNFQTHTLKTCHTAIWYIMKLKWIKDYLDLAACETLVDALVTPHCHFSNGTLIWCNEYIIRMYQWVQYTAAKIILGNTNRDSVTECLRELHWLPIKSRIQFKILTIVYKYQNYSGCKYLTNLLCLNISSRKVQHFRILKMNS